MKHHARTTHHLMMIAFIAFISLGLPDGLLGVAWPGIRSHFNLPVDALGLVLVFSTSGYMLSSFFSGVLMRRLGVGGLLSLSCAATATALGMYAVTPTWWLFVLFATVGGLGAGAIDAGINTYVAQNYNTRVMQWLHASFGVGVTLGPVIMTLGISLTSRWQVGYLVVSAGQGLLAVLFFATRGLWLGVSAPEDSDPQAGHEHDATLLETLQTIPALLSMLMFFLYTGVELGLGLWTYSLLTESRGMAPEAAGFITGSYWAMFTLGRILAGWYTSRIGSRTLLYLSVGLAFLGVALLLPNLGALVSVVGVGLAGFAVAPIFPGLVSDTEHRVGRRHQANTIGMQIAAAGFGGAVVPAIAGVFARVYGLESIPRYLALALFLLLLSLVISHLHQNKASGARARK